MAIQKWSLKKELLIYIFGIALDVDMKLFSEVCCYLRKTVPKGHGRIGSTTPGIIYPMCLTKCLHNSLKMFLF